MWISGREQRSADCAYRAVDVDSVQAAEHTLEVAGGQHSTHITGKEVRLAPLDAGQDPQFRNLVSAPGDVGQVPLDVERRPPPVVREYPVCEVDVLGERQP